MDRHRLKPPWFIFMKYEEGKQPPYEMHGVSLEYNLVGSVMILCAHALSCWDFSLMKLVLFFVATSCQVNHNAAIKGKVQIHLK